MQKLDEFDAAYASYLDTYNKLHDKAWSAIGQLQRDYVTKMEIRAFDAFINEFGDPDIWEGHKKTLKKGTIPDDNWRSAELRFVITRLVERGHEIAGRTVAELFDIFKAEPPADNDYTGKKNDYHSWNARINPALVELDEDLLDLRVAE